MSQNSELYKIMIPRTADPRKLDQFNPIMCPFYCELGKEQQELYKEVLGHVENREESFEPKQKLTIEQCSETMNAVLYDQPGLFYYRGASHWTYVKDTVTVISIRYIEQYMNDTVVLLERLKRKIDAFHEKLKGRDIDYIETAVHSWLVRNVHYTHGEKDQSAYAAMVEGDAVCAGYSRAFQYIMMSFGVPCYYVAGRGIKDKKDEDEGQHAWNMIYLRGQFYNLDMTWDDGYDQQEEELIRYKYYNVSDSIFEKSHVRRPEFDFLPKCTATECSFEALRGYDWRVSLTRQKGLTYEKMIDSKEGLYQLLADTLSGMTDNETTISFSVKGQSMKEMIDSQMRLAHNNVKKMKGISWKTTTHEFDGVFWVKIVITLK